LQLELLIPSQKLEASYHAKARWRTAITAKTIVHFVLCDGVVDLNFFAALNVPESPHAQAAEIQKAVGFATVVYVSDSLFSAEDMFPFADLQGSSGGRKKSVFSV